jgi:hypothetical protein
MTEPRWLLKIGSHFYVELQNLSLRQPETEEQRGIGRGMRPWPRQNNLHAITFTLQHHNFLSIITIKTITIICGLKHDE